MGCELTPYLNPFRWTLRFKWHVEGFDDPSEVEGKYFLPWVERLIPCLPKSTLQVLRCGTGEISYEEDEPDIDYEDVRGNSHQLKVTLYTDLIWN